MVQVLEGLIGRGRRDLPQYSALGRKAEGGNVRAEVFVLPTFFGFGTPILVSTETMSGLERRPDLARTKGIKLMVIDKPTRMWDTTTLPWDAQTTRRGFSVNPVMVNPVGK